MCLASGPGGPNLQRFPAGVTGHAQGNSGLEHRVPFGCRRTAESKNGWKTAVVGVGETREADGVGQGRALAESRGRRRIAESIPLQNVCSDPPRAPPASPGGCGRE